MLPPGLKSAPSRPCNHSSTKVRIRLLTCPPGASHLQSRKPGGTLTRKEGLRKAGREEKGHV